MKPPQAYYTLFPRGNNAPNANNRPRPNATQGTSTATKKPESLISRYHLEEKITSPSQEAEDPSAEIGGKAVWEDSAEKREQSLKERKEKMILAARQ
jgi:hypothetical protein